MDIKEFYKLQNTLQKEGIMFCYSGYMTQNVLSAIGETIKIKLEANDTDLGKSKKVFSVFVEGVQNVIRYSADKILEDDSTNSDIRYGIVSVGNDKNGISVQCGNLILNSDVENMKNRISFIEGKSKDDLKKLYKQKILDGPDEGSKGASLGLIEMARRSGQEMIFSFERIDNDFTFFFVKAVI